MLKKFKSPNERLAFRFVFMIGIVSLFAAGDVARFPIPALGGHTRVEHEDHANTHGSRVGANMAGAGVPYDHLPFFYSDLFELGYEALVAGRLGSIGCLCHYPAGYHLGPPYPRSAVILAITLYLLYTAAAWLMLRRSRALA